MLRARQRAQNTHQDESYFISMTDIMVGLLFIFVIIIMYFAFQLRIQAEEQENYDAQASEYRTLLLRQIQEELQKQGVDDVVVESEQGILRFPAGLLFASGSAEINPRTRFIAGELSSAFSKVLVCAVFDKDGGVFSKSVQCQSENPNRIYVESIFFEGHTDNIPILGGLPEDININNNLRLSARRATNAYQEVIDKESILLDFYSPNDQPIFAASAFGETRPIASNSDDDGRASNRRIDIRMLMHVPKTNTALREYKKRLEGLLD